MPEKTVEERVAELEDLQSGAKARRLKLQSQVKALEIISRRHVRKSKKQVLKGIFLPTPICGVSTPDTDGVVFRAMMPCYGTIIRASFDIEGVENLEQAVKLQMEVNIGNDLYVRDFVTKKAVEENVELPIFGLSKVTIRVVSANVEGLVWTTLLFLPDTSVATIRKLPGEEVGDAEETGTQTEAPGEG